MTDKKSDTHKKKETKKSTSKKTISKPKLPVATLSLETLVMHTKVARMSEKQALQYIAENGFNIKRDKYYKVLKSQKDDTFVKAYEIAKIGFLDQHIQRIKTLETVEKLFWDEYNAEGQHWKKAKILENVVNIQPFISNAYDSTRKVMEAQDGLKKELLLVEASIGTSRS